MSITRKFCWKPTPVYSSRFVRAGFRWLRSAWIAEDGKAYTSHKAAFLATDDTVIKSSGPSPDGGYEVSLQGTACQAMAAIFADQFIATHPEGEKGNLVEISFVNEKTGPLVITMQRKQGKTPMQVVDEVKAQRDELLAALKEIIKFVGHHLPNDQYHPAAEEIASAAIAKVEASL